MIGRTYKSIRSTISPQRNPDCSLCAGGDCVACILPRVIVYAGSTEVFAALNGDKSWIACIGVNFVNGTMVHKWAV